MDYDVVVEGATRLKVPLGGGISSKEEVFYNPHMRLNRDLSVALCRLLKPKTFVDIMAGSGARGIRVAKEAGVDVTLNDLNPKAVQLIKDNAGLNGVDVTVESRDARSVLVGRRFDYFDLDPFGPPVSYVDSVISAARWGNIIGVCATDTSALCGSYPKACVRKYDAVPLRCDCYDEVGLRLLIGFVARTALRHESGIEPLFCHSTRHYMRVQVRLTSRHQASMKDMGYLQYCFKCLWRGYRGLHELKEDCGCGGKLQTAGPIWVGHFADESLCRRLSEELLSGEYSQKAAAVKLASQVAAEQSVKTPYYDVHKLCGKAGADIPKMGEIEALLRGSGGMFVRTHFNDVGFRTDLCFSELLSLLGE